VRFSSSLDDRPWVRRVSPFARLAWIAYGVLIAYSGLTPWTGWRDLGVSPFAYLTAPLPAYVTQFDLLVNVLAYLPLGALGVLALYPRARGAVAIAVSLATAIALSGSVEALQTYLPRRVPSNLDLATNTLGALLGAAVASPLAEPLLDRGRLMQLRARWFVGDGAPLLLVIALWPLAQIHPSPMLFGNGHARGLFAQIADWFGATWPTLGADGSVIAPAEFVLAEAIVVCAAVLATGLAAAALMQRQAPRWRLLLALIATALFAKMLSYGVLFGSEHAFAWWTPGAFGGLTVGVLALLAAAIGGARAQMWLALLAACVLIVAVNVVPDNPYYIAWLQPWRRPRLEHFNALAQWLAIAWPYLLLFALCARVVRLPRAARAMSINAGR
jgi:VanZ family protein